MADEFVNKSITMDVQSAERGEAMSKEDDRSFSALVRILVNREWNRRHPQAVSVSAETVSPTEAE